MRPSAALPSRAGVGFKPEHFEAVMAGGRKSASSKSTPRTTWARAARRIAGWRPCARFPLSLHGVGLSIGGPRPLDRAHLKRLAALKQRYQPGLFSEHLAWSSHDIGFLDDLLPLP